MQHLAIDLLADAIAYELTGTEPGHCARVDFLERDQAQAICEEFSKRATLPQTSLHILTRDPEQTTNPRYITTDRAIELRNRKTSRLCLFVPSDMVDAAFSSLANSFALIDGRSLYGKVLHQLVDTLPAQAQRIVRDVFAYLRAPLRASDSQKLAFCSALADRAESEDLDHAGLDLWRVGLIADGGSAFVANLGRNRNSAIKLALPLKIYAGVTERVSSTRVDRSTAARLVSFFRSRSMNEIFSWSQALAAGDGPTFDQWSFPKEEPSDITGVTLAPFIDREGLVQRYSRLAQPDGHGGSLIAKYGDARDAVLVVKWTTEPTKPRNLDRWRVEIVSTNEDSDVDIDLPDREVASQRRSLTIKLDLELESPPDGSFCIRVTPLDAAGDILRNPETNEDIVSNSLEFFLSPDIEIRAKSTQSTRRRTVPSIAFGRLEAAIETSDAQLEEQEPLWASRELDYFSLRLNQRRVVTIGISPTLRELERRVLNEPRSGGRFLVSVGEVRPIDSEACLPFPLDTYTGDTWNAFWRAREHFFGRITKATPRDCIEVASWSDELANAAIRYGQAYKSLLSELLDKHVPDEELYAALSIDTLLIRTAGESETPEEALVFLPTHPVRAAWMAGYTQLLLFWERDVLGRPAKQRAAGIDLATIRMLTPINVPAFGYHPQAQSAFAFFQNLRFFVGIALPPNIPDPQRRFADIAVMLGDESDTDVVGELSPARLAEHIKAFYQLHAYNQSLVITLVNADQGALAANAITRTLESMVQGDDDTEAVPLPTIRLQSYVEGNRAGGISGLNQIRQILTEHAVSKGTSHLTPVLSSSIQPVSVLAAHGPAGRVDWKPSIKGSPHLFIIGIPGQGKSWTTTRILTRLGEQHVPALVLDFHGQFADPSGPFAQRVGATTIDAAEGLPFSPFEAMTTNGKTDWKINSQGIAEIFAYIVNLGGIQRDALYNAIMDAYKARGFGTGDTTGLTYPTPSDVLRCIERRERDRRVSNISARCRPLLEMDLFTPESGHPDLLSMVRRGLVIDLHNLHSEVLQMTAGAFVLRKIYRDMVTWGVAEHLRLAIVLDEAHRLAKDVTLPKIMKEGRKFGISVVVASQGMNDFHADVLGNAGTKILFRTNYPDSKKIANYIRGRQGQDLASQIEQLGVGTSYVQTSDMPQGAVVKMYPPE